ncbi:zinc finger BED domain-containing protein 5-like [Hydra vulgaris]|uniref:Zinc finger BED domain-containing protein 5-like n=1 Tax=Hydra vulgaris TaxID=6087 RepID=A0ABM4C8U2_HYDVU
MVSWILAKNLKAFTDGEIIKECMIETSKFLFRNDKKVHDQFQSMHLSARTVTRKIEKMVVNVYEQLSNNLSEAEFVSIALDESTDLVELLGIEPLEITTIGQDIYDKLFKILLNRKVPLQKISSVVTDGAPAMIGRIRGVVTLLRNSGEFPNKFMSYHCVIHQEALCAKVATIDNVMTAVVKTINHIRSNALKRRQFRALMEQNEDKHNDLLPHLEVRWLSRGNILNRFWECLPRLKDFEEADILKAEDELINFQCDNESRRKAPKKDGDSTFGENLTIFCHAVIKERFPNLIKKMQIDLSITDNDVLSYYLKSRKIIKSVNKIMCYMDTESSFSNNNTDLKIDSIISHGYYPFNDIVDQKDDYGVYRKKMNEKYYYDEFITNNWEMFIKQDTILSIDVESLLDDTSEENGPEIENRGKAPLFDL